ncbi:MAG: hypothetical protein QXP97_07695 [Desulfurococcus sp.]|uniref:hypothetical protein n=1 Tax=Desulfurococcus sp. TaxID=51678 RepID=UPI0031673C87
MPRRYNMSKTLEKILEDEIYRVLVEALSEAPRFSRDLVKRVWLSTGKPVPWRTVLFRLSRLEDLGIARGERVYGERQILWSLTEAAKKAISKLK